MKGGGGAVELETGKAGLSIAILGDVDGAGLAVFAVGFVVVAGADHEDGVGVLFDAAALFEHAEVEVDGGHAFGVAVELGEDDEGDV